MAATDRLKSLDYHQSRDFEAQRMKLSRQDSITGILIGLHWSDTPAANAYVLQSAGWVSFRLRDFREELLILMHWENSS
jgi:hypothetical protein